MNGMALCAGAGGLELGVERAVAGYRTVCWVEWELSAAGILAARMEDGSLAPAPIWDDVRTFDGTAWRGSVDLVTAGFPCQPWSVAGKRQGTDDDRWLWPDIARCIREVEPRYVFLENVRGLISGDGGLSAVLGDLAGMGFDAEWCVLSAAEVGAPHKRERVFILAYAGHTERPGRDGASGGTEGEPRPELASRGSDVADGAGARREEAGERRLEHAGGEPETGRGAVGDAIGTGGERGLPGRGADAEGWQEPDGSTWQSGGVFPPGPGERERWAILIAGHPELSPATEPAVRGVADGLATRMDLSRAQRLRMLGNGVVPQQAEAAFRILAGRIP